MYSFLNSTDFSTTGLPRWLSGKESTCNVRDAGSVPESGRSPGEGNRNPLQHSCLGNPMDRGAPGGLQSMGSQRAGHASVTEHAHTGLHGLQLPESMDALKPQICRNHSTGKANYKLHADFQLHRDSVPLTPILFKS